MSLGYSNETSKESGTNQIIVFTVHNEILSNCLMEYAWQLVPA